MTLLQQNETAQAEVARLKEERATAIDAKTFAIKAGAFHGHPFHGSSEHIGGDVGTKANKASGEAHDATEAAKDQGTHEEASSKHAKASEHHHVNGNHPSAAYHDAMSHYHEAEARCHKGEAEAEGSKKAEAEASAKLAEVQAAHQADVATAKSEIEKLAANLTAKDAEFAKAKDLLKNPAFGKIAGLSIEQAATAAAGSANDDAEHKSNFKTRADADKAYRLVMTDAVAAAAFRRDNWAILGLKRPV